MNIFRKPLQKFSLENLEKILSRKAYKIDLSWLLIGLAITVYTAIFSFFTIMKYYSFRTYAWDLGIFNQAFWTTVHDGKFFYNTPELLINPSGSFFGIHFSPILFVVLPFYAILSTPETLLVVQSFVLALGTIPLYKLVMHTVKYRTAGLVFVSVYLLYPALEGINWFDFHVQSFLPLFFLSAMYFLEKQHWKGYFIFIFLSLICEEHATMIVLFIGLFVMIRHRNHLASVLKMRNLKDTVFLVSVITPISAILWYVMTLQVRNAFFPVNSAFLSTFKASSNWSVLGITDPIMIPLQIILHPANALFALSYDFLLKIGYLLILFGPLAFRPFLKAKYLLPTLPWFSLSFFSNYIAYYMLFNQYTAYVVAFIFVAAVYSIRDNELSSPKKMKKPLLVFLLCGLIAFVLVSPLSPVVAMLYSDSGLKPVTQHERLLYEVLGYVPPNASIITHNNLFPQVSSRINAYATPTIDPIWKGRASECTEFIDNTLDKVDYVLVDMKTDGFSSGVVFALLQGNRSFGVVASGDGIILFKKNYSADSVILEPYNVRYDYNSLTLYSGEIIGIAGSTSKMVMHINGLSASSPMFWYGPRSLLPPGTYNVTLRLNINGTGQIFKVEICKDHGSTILESKTFSADDLVDKGNWTDQTFQLDLQKPLVDFEVRGMNISPDADIYLDYIDVKQVNPGSLGR
jgi:uncharacterized membrane protein